MPDIGSISFRLSADFGDILSQLDALGSSIDRAFGAPDVSAVLGAMGDVSSAMDGLGEKARSAVAEITDAFANVSISVPTGSLVSDSAAADIAKEIALAFESTPINLSIDTTTAGSAAADVAAEIAQAFGSVEIAAPDLSAYTGALESLAETAQADAEQVAAAFADIQITGPDLSGLSSGSFEAPDLGAISEALTQLDSDAAASAEQMVQAFAGASLEAPDDSAITDELAQLPNDASAAADAVSQNFADVQIAAPDVTPITEEFAGLCDTAGAAAETVAADFAGVSLQAPDTSAVTAGFAAVEEAAQQAATEVSNDFADAQIAAPDFGPVRGALNDLLGTAQTAGEQFVADFAAGLDTSDLSAFKSALDDIVASLGQAEGGPAKDFADQLVAIAEAARQVADAEQQAAAQAAEAAERAARGYSEFSDAAQAVIDRQNDLDSTMNQALATFQELQTAYENGAISANTLELAQQQLQSATDAAEHSVEEEESGLKNLAEAMAGVGEALAITDGLKNLGSEALSAADGLTHASIALTAITGDAAGAETTIKGLEALGISDGLSMPALLTAATRMQALLPEGTDVVKLLGNIADGAAVMGTSIEAAANKFDMIANSGNASARTLSALGLNLTAIADAMNTLNPALNLTAENAAKAFKALDPGDRIQVLQTALQGLAGTAQDVAEKTFGGQWQILENQWEAVMAGVGRTLLPVITSLTGFVGDVLVVVQNLSEAFERLPGPVKDVAATIGILVASVVPLAGGIAAASLAFSGLSTIAATASGALSALGALFGPMTAETTAAAAAETALATATEAEAGAAGTAATAIEAETAALVAKTAAAEAAATASEGAAAAGVEGAAGASVGVGAGAIEAEGAAAGVAATETGLLAAAALDAGIAFAALAIPLVAAGAALDALIPNVQDATKGWADYNDQMSLSAGPAGEAVTNIAKVDQSMIDMAETAKKVTPVVDALLGDLATKFGLLGPAAFDGKAAFQDFTGAVQDFLTKTTTAQGKIADLKLVVDMLTEAVKTQTAVNQSGYIPTIKDVQAAQEALDAALKKTTGSVKAQQDALTPLAQATRDFVDNTVAALDPLQTEAAKLQAVVTNVDLMRDHLNDANANLLTAKQRLDDMKIAAEAGAASTADVTKAEQDLEAAAGKAATAQKALNDAIKALNSSEAKDAVASINAVLGDLLKASKDAGTSLEALGVDIDNVGAKAPALTPLNQAMIDLGSAATKPHPSIVQLETDLDALAAKARSTGDWENYDAMLGKVDATINKLGKVDLAAATDAMGQLTQKMIDQRAPLDAINTQMGNWETSINKLAKTDLPDAINQQQAYIEKLNEIGAPLSAIEKATEDWDKMQIQLAQDSGTSSAAYIGNIEKISLAQKAAAIDAAGFSTAEVAAINDINKGFETLGSSMANAIISGNNLGEALIGVFKKIAQSILGDLIQGALAPLESQLLKFEGTLFPNLDLGVKSLGTGIKSLGDQAQAAADAMKNMQAGADALAAAQKAQTAAATANTTATTAHTPTVVADTAAITPHTGAVTVDTTATTGEATSMTAEAAADDVATASTTAEASAMDFNTEATTGEAASMTAEADAAGADTIAKGGDTEATVAETVAEEVDTEATIEETAATIADTVAQIAFASVVTAVASVIGAIAGIVGDIYLAAIDTKLFITNTTLAGIKNEAVNLRADLWSQYGHMYDRLGEVKNDLDSISDNISALAGGGQTSSSSGGPTVQSDLDLIVVSMQNTERNTGATNFSVQALNQTSTPYLQQIISDLQDINNSLFKINTSILSNGSGGAAHSQMVSDAVLHGAASISGNATSNASGVMGKLDTVDASISQQISDEQKLLATAEAAAAAATDTPSKIQALQQALAADLALVQLEEKNGNSVMSTIYSQGADAIKAQLAALGVTVSTDTGNITTAINSTSQQTGAYIAGAVTSSGAAIVGAVNGAASTIAASVIDGLTLQQGQTGGATSGGAINITTGGPGRGAGGAADGVQSPVVQDVKLPGGGTGAYTTPLSGTGTTATSGGSGRSVGNPNPGDTTVKVVPQYDSGGMVDSDGLLAAHKGEAVLTPEQTDALLQFGQRMSSDPNITGAGDTLISKTTTGGAHVIPQGGQPERVGYGTQGPDAASIGPVVDAVQAANQAAKDAAQSMQDRLDLLNQELAASKVNSGLVSVQTIELENQINDLLKQIAGSTDKTATNTGTMATNPPGANSISPAATDYFGYGGVGPGPGPTAGNSISPAATDYFGYGGVGPGPGPGAGNSKSPGADRYFDAGNSGPGPRAIGPPSVAPTGDSLSPSATRYNDGQYIGPPPTPHALFSGYNPYGASQPFLSGSFAEGGPVLSDGIYQLHAKEYVLNPQDAAMAMSLGSGGGSAGGRHSAPSSAPIPGAGGGITINAPFTANGVQNPQQLMQMFTQHLKAVLPRAAIAGS